MTPRQHDIEHSVIGSNIYNIGYTEDKTHSYAVRFAVDRYSMNKKGSRLAGHKIYEALKSAKAKINERLSRTGATTPVTRQSTTPSYSRASATINIADLLKLVKENYPDILPENVLHVFGSSKSDYVDINGTMANSTRFSEDTDGNELSEQQIEYFKDSKVRDNEGRLIKVYHGTKADFTVFDRDKIGSTGRFEGAGFNFTPVQERASSYANGQNVMEGYLNISHPLSSNATPDRILYIKEGQIPGGTRINQRNASISETVLNNKIDDFIGDVKNYKENRGINESVHKSAGSVFADFGATEMYRDQYRDSPVTADRAQKLHELAGRVFRPNGKPLLSPDATTETAAKQSKVSQVRTDTMTYLMAEAEMDRKGLRPEDMKYDVKSGQRPMLRAGERLATDLDWSCPAAIGPERTSTPPCWPCLCTGMRQRKPGTMARPSKRRRPSERTARRADSSSAG